MNVSMRTGLALAIGLSIVAVVGCRDDGPASSAGVQGASDRADSANAPRRMNSLKVSGRAAAGGSAASSATSEAAPTVNGTPAPTVNGSPARRDAAPTITQSTNGAANRQSLTARVASGPFAQRQDGSGNTQVLNVDGASSAGV